MSSDLIIGSISSSCYNTSGNLFIVSYLGNYMILKRVQSQNEINKIELLDKYRDAMPGSFVIPRFLICLDNKDLYFAMEYIKGNNFSDILSNTCVSLCDKKGYLTSIGGILDRMKDIRCNTPLKDFYLGDLHEDNFMVSNDRLYTIDLDGIRVNSLSPIASYLQAGTLFSSVSTDKYKVEDNSASFVRYLVDENTDLYCYTMIILNFLYGDNVNNMDIGEYYDYLNYLDDIGINKSLLYCFDRVVSDGDNINPMNYIASLSYKDVGKSRKIVYRYNR